jgi:molybdate transport system substrate-binding protein
LVRSFCLLTARWGRHRGRARGHKLLPTRSRVKSASWLLQRSGRHSKQFAQRLRRPSGALLIEYGSARVNLKEKILKGQAFDVALLLPDVNEELAKAGKIMPEVSQIARVDVAIGLRGDVTPDLSISAAVKKAMLGAKALRWSDTGAALLTVNKILDTLGIREATKAQHAMPADVALGPGEYEINIYPLSEILSNKNVRNAGPVIKDLQVPSTITAVISKNTSDVASAKALIEFLQGPTMDPFLTESGMKR